MQSKSSLSLILLRFTFSAHFSMQFSETLRVRLRSVLVSSCETALKRFYHLRLPPLPIWKCPGAFESETLCAHAPKSLHFDAPLWLHEHRNRCLHHCFHHCRLHLAEVVTNMASSIQLASTKAELDAMPAKTAPKLAHLSAHLSASRATSSSRQSSMDGDLSPMVTSCKAGVLSQALW